MRSGTPLNGSAIGSGAATPTYAPPTSNQFESALFKSRGSGQEILPSAVQPKRTESLYIAAARGSISGGGGGGGMPKVSFYNINKINKSKFINQIIIYHIFPIYKLILLFFSYIY